MKHVYFKSGVLVCLLAVSFSLSGQTLREESQKDFNTTPASKLSISNQFGNITVTDWDQSKVSIVYVVEVTDKDEASAKKLMDQIKINFSEENGKIMAETKIGKDGDLDLKKDKSTNQSFRIDYEVKCPRNIPISLENKFGDISLATLTGPVEVEIQFGSLHAVSLTGPETSIECQFGKLYLTEVGDASIEIQHSEVCEITKSGNLSIEAQFSEVRIGSVKTLEAELKNANTTVENLSGSLNLEGNMGKTKVKNVASGFTSIDIEQNIGEVSLTMDPKAGYKLNAKSSLGNLDLPENLKVTPVAEQHAAHVHEDIQIKVVKGVVGNGAAVVNAEVNLGSLSIK